MGNKPKILLLDIETAPLNVYVWGLWDQNVGLNMVKHDWHILSIAAKWLDDKEIFYLDQRKQKTGNDKPILEMIWKLLNEADIVVGQNSKSFDIKKINARFLAHGMRPPSPFRQIDTKILAKKHFALTSNKLEYMSDKLCKKFKKLKHKEFPGFELWDQCLKGNIKAWKEMELYNKHDVLALEELYHVLKPWEDTISMKSFYDQMTCLCGSKEFVKNGFKYTNSTKYQRYACKNCGRAEYSSLAKTKEKK